MGHGGGAGRLTFVRPSPDICQAVVFSPAPTQIPPSIAYQEFLLAAPADASNANYSSTLVAEGPAVKMFERLQHAMIVDDLAVMRRVVENAIRAGRLDAAALDLIEIEVEPPRLAVRDRLKDAQVDQILVRAGAMSVQRMALRHGLDPEVERRLMGEAPSPLRTGPG